MLRLWSGIAQAEPPSLISYGGFSSVTPYPVGVAVDPSSGDLFVAGFFGPLHPPIDKFEPSGALVTPPSPFGENDNGGATVNPVNKDLYVYDLGNIDTYDPSTGVLLAPPASFPVPPSSNPAAGGYPIVQIAADAAGNVYVPVIAGNEVLEYDSSGTLLNTFTGGSGEGALNGPTGVAVDSSGNLWVADAGDSRIEELSQTDEPIDEIKSEGVVWVALDDHGDVLAIVKNNADFCGSVKGSCSHLVEYSTAGAQLADVGAGSFEAGPGSHFLPMVAVDQASERVYVSDASNEKVWIFAPPTAPAVAKELTSEVTSSEAKLGALVNPGGIEATYRFEYLSEAAFQADKESFSGPEPAGSVPFPEGSVGEGLASRAVWAAASGLAPGTTYHYRVVATNEVGTAVGSTQTFTTETAEQASCPNEALRGGFSTRLPDCRAYELVTPSTKTSVQIEASNTPPAADGDAISFTTKEPLPGAPTGGNYYMAARGEAGWMSEDMIPLESYTGVTCEQKLSEVSAYSSELSKALVVYGRNSRSSESGSSSLDTECNAEGLQVTSGEPVGYENLLLRDNATGAYRLINATPPGMTPADAHFKGASSGLSHVVFSEMAPLTADALPGVENLYEWDEGVLRLLTVLPNGSPAPGSFVEGGISADGSHILFTSGGALYVRIDGERTVQVDKSEGPGPSGGGSFSTASANGSQVFFTDDKKLTSDSTAEVDEPDLYECEIIEVEEEIGKRITTCRLSDLTVAKTGEHADVLRVSALGSHESSHVYFLAKGVLADNKREYTNSEGHGVAEEAKKGQSNLYSLNKGTPTFIATVGNGEKAEGITVSPDGTWLAFDSLKSLTGYENTPSNEAPVDEIYLYDATSQQLNCASCNPTGEAPIAGGANIAPSTRRPLSDGGRLFFETFKALVPSDTNGQVDVYEYEDGQPDLISSGTSPMGSSFQGASESGDDVFFLSRQQLVPQDINEEARMIYDARTDGGFTEPASPPSCATADACRTPVSPQPSIFGAPSSATFSGSGNISPTEVVKAKAKLKPKPGQCKKGFVKKRGRCVKRSKRARKSVHANKKTGK
jgi:DNA-binding beta-propeller fold protein YncE